VAIRPAGGHQRHQRVHHPELGVAAICQELNSTVLCRCFTVSPAGACFHDWGSQPCGGASRNKAATTTAAPWMIPHWMNAVW